MKEWKARCPQADPGWRQCQWRELLPFMSREKDEAWLESPQSFQSPGPGGGGGVEPYKRVQGLSFIPGPCGAGDSIG